MNSKLFYPTKTLFALLILALMVFSMKTVKAQFIPDGNYLYTLNQNVGIGTETPLVKLQVNGSLATKEVGTEEILKLGRAVNPNKSFQQAASFKLGRWKTSGSVHPYTRFDIALRGNRFADDFNTDVTVMTLLDNGNVGIGTTTPASNLSVNGTGNSLFQLQSTGESDILFKSGSSAWEVGTGYTTVGQNNFYFHSNGGTKMLITESGSVGIGTTSPAELLHVNGNIRTNKLITLNDIQNQGITIHSANDFNDESYIEIINDYSDYSEWKISAVTELRSGVPGNMDDAFLSIKNRLSPVYALTIDPSNNVGIGITDVPTGYKLAVDGKIMAEELTIKMSENWPDYVFAPNYNLKPLSEVEEYIEENQHLPEIPSEQEVEEDGITVGEMNALLLKKIEELTLYTIQQQKEIDALKAQITK